MTKLLPACLCGARVYADEEEARKAEPAKWSRVDHPDGTFSIVEHLCPECGTFATDHLYFEGGEGRCMDCDIRYHSHGAPRAAEVAA